MKNPALIVLDRLLLVVLALALSAAGIFSREMLPCAGPYLRRLADWVDPPPHNPSHDSRSRIPPQGAVRAPVVPDQSTRYVYLPVGKRDPFAILEFCPSGGDVPSNDGRVKTPLEKWGLDQLRLSLTVTGTATPMAMVEDPDHRGWPVRIGDFIGQNGGMVIGIHRDEVVVLETITDHATGRVYPRNVRLMVPGRRVGPKLEDLPRPTDLPSQFKWVPRFELREQAYPERGAQDAK